MQDLRTRRRIDGWLAFFAAEHTSVHPSRCSHGARAGQSRAEQSRARSLSEANQPASQRSQPSSSSIPPSLSARSHPSLLVLSTFYLFMLGTACFSPQESLASFSHAHFAFSLSSFSSVILRSRVFRKPFFFVPFLVRSGCDLRPVICRSYVPAAILL